MVSCDVSVAPRQNVCIKPIEDAVDGLHSISRVNKHRAQERLDHVPEHLWRLPHPHGVGVVGDIESLHLPRCPLHGLLQTDRTVQEVLLYFELGESDVAEAAVTDHGLFEERQLPWRNVVKPFLVVPDYIKVKKCYIGSRKPVSNEWQIAQPKRGTRDEPSPKNSCPILARQLAEYASSGGGGELQTSLS
jgi:hypothetical protein